MKKFGIFFIILFFLIAFGVLKLYHPSVEFDEGDYLTTFLSVQRGFPLYAPTSYLQLPGFFILTNPFLSLFGVTLPIARLTIFFYSLIGIAGVFWLSLILTEDLLLGLITTALLYAIPLYTKEILTFHLDSLPNVFSLLTLIGLFLFLKKQKTLWIIFISFFLTLGIMIKIDISLLPTIVVLYFLSRNEKKNLLKDLFVSVITCLITFLVISVPFGLHTIWNVFVFRTAATQKSHLDISLFFSYVLSQPILYIVSFLGVIASIVTIIKKKGTIFLLGILLWVITTILLLFLYHPLELHHLMILTFPSSLLLSYSVILLTKKTFQGRYLYPISFVSFIAVMVCNFFYSSSSQNMLNNLEQQAIIIIQHHSSQNDYIVTDDELLGPFSQRNTPPQLTDISFVDIHIGYITQQTFEKGIEEYHPKLILPITGRLRSIKNFEEIVKKNNYQLLDVNVPYSVYIKQ